MMTLSIQTDPILSKFVILSLAIILAGFLFRVLKQPTLLAYIIVGLLLGPNGFEVITNESNVTNLGALGLVLLLFFIGMEISLPQLITNWRISVIGTTLQIIVTIFAVFIAGKYLGMIKSPGPDIYTSRRSLRVSFSRLSTNLNTRQPRKPGTAW